MTSRVLIVDDSPTMRGILSAVLTRYPEIEIVGMAGDPHEARAAIKALNPDVVTLDVEMPRMSGLEFLEKLMRLRPTPVIMVSTLTQQGAEASVQALELGAVDCVGKPADGDREAFAGLAEKVKAAARSRVRALADRAKPTAPRTAFRPNGNVVAIGSSTGGVEALISVLASFPENCPPTVVTQHMPANFIVSFAQRLDRLCAPQVVQAEEGMPLTPGRVIIAPGGDAHLAIIGGAQKRCKLLAEPPVNGHRPSVDVMFNAVATACGAQAVGLILTGMGKDGAKGMLAMRNAGAATFGQDEATCVVYGMPRAAFEIGAVRRQAPLGKLAGLVLDQCDDQLMERQ